MVTKIGIKMLNDIHASLAATVMRLHRVQDYAPVRMKTDPVIGKYRVGRMRFESIVEYNDFNFGSSQLRHERIKFLERRRVLFLR